MIGLDTNVLARYYIEDKRDAESDRQKLAARQLIDSGRPLMVAKTVILELEWVMRGYYRFSQKETLGALRHLLQMAHVMIEDRAAIEQALSLCTAGVDLADALHHSSYRSCASMASFDDRKFARRAKKLGISPTVFVPS